MINDSEIKRVFGYFIRNLCEKRYAVEQTVCH